MHSKSRTIDLILNAFATAMLALVCGGCASSETQVQKAARDWCMTIRGSQVIPVYPLTEDIQPGDSHLQSDTDQSREEMDRASACLLKSSLALADMPNALGGSARCRCQTSPAACCAPSSQTRAELDSGQQRELGASQV